MRAPPAHPINLQAGAGVWFVCGGEGGITAQVGWLLACLPICVIGDHATPVELGAQPHPCPARPAPLSCTPLKCFTIPEPKLKGSSR